MRPVPDAPFAAQTPPSKKQHYLPERLPLSLDFTATTDDSASSTHPHVLFSPIHYEPGYAYPLLVWLHDAGEDERQVMRVMPSVSMRNYVAVAPQGMAEERAADSFAWSPADVNSMLHGACSQKKLYDWPVQSEESVMEFTAAEQRIFDCMATARKRCNVASNRIFIGGFGTGGTMALRVALTNPEHFSGVISLGGAFPIENRALHRWAAARSLRVFLGTGRMSNEFSPSAACRSLELLHTAGISVALRDYDCGQELIPAMLQDINRWMMDIVCG